MLNEKFRQLYSKIIKNMCVKSAFKQTFEIHF